MTYRGEVIDLLGLNNILIAHTKGDRHGFKNHASFNKNIFYKLLPDIFINDIGSTITNIPGKIPLTNNEWSNKVFKGLLLEKRFNSIYTFANVKLNNGKYLSCYFKNSCLIDRN